MAAFLLTPLVSLGVAGAAVTAAPRSSPASQSSPVTIAPSSVIGLSPALPAVRGVHLDAAPSASTDVVTPGQAFSVRADITPKRGVHVYAPGNASYTPVSLTIDPQAGIVSGSAKYPKAVEFFFAPLKERIQVFSTGFRLERELTVTPAASTTLALSAAPALTIRGALEYQACDDKVCYLPQTLPLTWTVVLKR
jgi:DsbC/DsbD-like thiol-disulfide interchange protein